MMTSSWAINPGRLIDIFTSMEYSIGQAVCDLIDNSLDAGATQVDIVFSYTLEEDTREGRRYLMVVDNGGGISPKDLDERMSLGADRSYGMLDLGKFGVGLKLSSLSQAEEVTVFSREGGCRRISARHIRNQGRLELQHRANTSEPAEAAKTLAKKAGGTVVLWERMERYALAFGKKAVRDDHNKQVEVLREFVAMTFHRFLSDGSDARLQITLNNDPLTALDPMGLRSSEPEFATISHDVTIKASGRGVKVKMVILPHRSRVENVALMKRLAKVSSANEAQGLYFYRNDRLIAMGGWDCLSLTSDEHMKLAKVAIEVPQALDDAFRLNPTKTAYEPPALFADRLHNVVSVEKRRWTARDPKPMSFRQRAHRRYTNEGKPRPKRPVSRTPRVTKTPAPLAPQAPPTTPTSTVPPPVGMPKAARKTVLEASERVRISIGEKGDLVSCRNNEDGVEITFNRAHELYAAAWPKLLAHLAADDDI